MKLSRILPLKTCSHMSLDYILSAVPLIYCGRADYHLVVELHSIAKLNRRRIHVITSLWLFTHLYTWIYYIIMFSLLIRNLNLAMSFLRMRDAKSWYVAKVR